jgi:hypothetical protein
VRINPKYGSMRPRGAGSQPTSTFIENNFGSELAAGTVVQLFDSGPSEICADVKLCPGDVCSFMYQVCECVCVCLYVHTHTHTHPERERERERESAREKERDSHTNTHTHTH